ncbi:MAG: MBL fold metallo-hydrolase [Actinomycetota bacterium]|nr:MBL fold metallo-hydrolase [Actinomycetota bacterium]
MDDDYTGHAEPGGPALSRTVTLASGRQVRVRKLSVGPMDNNAYLLVDPAEGRALLIDAAAEPARLREQLRGLELVGVLTTHGHRDHWQALDAVADATGAPTWLHPGDRDLVPRVADQDAADGARVTFGEADVRLVHTPGHTPGSVCALLGETHLFTGDTLFPGGPGNTFGDPDAFRTIMRSLRDRLFTLPDGTWVYPGHGDDTTLGRERPHLGEWEARGW